MSSVPTQTQKDEVFLCMGSLRSELRCMEYLETIIAQLKAGTFQIHRQKPDLSSDEFSRVYSIFVDASQDIDEQVNKFLPSLIDFLEKNLDLAKEDRSRAMEG